MDDTSGGGRPLLVSGEPGRLDGVLRLAAANGAEPEVVGPGAVADVRRSWGTAPLVLVGADCADALAALQLPRREAVLLIGSGDDPQTWRRAMRAGAEQVLELPADHDQLADLLAACTDGPAGAPVVCVVGGCGGAGASVFAAALATAAAADGVGSLLVDADAWGGGLDLLTGGEHVEGLRWADLAAASGRVSAPSLRDLLPAVRQLSVLSWGRGAAATAVPAASMRAVVVAGQRGYRLVVVDVPRRMDAAAEEALVRADRAVVVVPAEVRAVAAAAAVVAAVTGLCGAVGLVVRGPGPSGLDAYTVADSLGLPLLAAMRPEHRLAESLDQGLGPLRRRRGPLHRACTQVLATVLDGAGGR